MLMESLKKLYDKICAARALVKYEGVFDDWESALGKCTGYDANEIFEKVMASAIAVRDGKACYERDSVLFYETKYNYPLVLHICGIAKEYANQINIIDWGGSLGSAYFQNRKLLQVFNITYKWTVIEQEHFVAFGKNNLCDQHLGFEYNLQMVRNIEKYNCIIFGSVLQYINFSDELLEQVVKLMIPYIIIERTPLGDKDYYLVERVKEPIYEASYPLHVLNREKLYTFLSKHGYTLIDEWETDYDSPIKIKADIIKYRSYVFKREG